MDNLKQTSTSKRETTEEFMNEKWREEQQTQMVKLIEYIDLWKNIKSHRNNILVYGNKKNNTQILPTQKKIAWNLQRDEDKSVIGSTKFGTQRATTLDNPLIGERQPHTDTQNHRSLKKSRSKSKSKEVDSALKSQSVGKLKRKMNFQIYKLNKELLRDYLNENKEYDSSYNHLIKDEDNLQSKLKKITTLISVLQKQEIQKQNIINRLSEDTLKHINDGSQQETQIQNPISNSHNPKSSQTFRVKTQAFETQQSFRSKGYISFKKLKQTCIKFDGCQEPNANKKAVGPILLKKKVHTNIYRRQQQSQKVQRAFDKEWQKIDEQIKLKFRRQAEYSLNMKKNKKFTLT